MDTKQPAVYIVANRKNGTLYIGVTSSLHQRIYQHKHGFFDGFTKRYGCKLLVYYKLYGTMEEAILREKYIKNCSRARKLALIEHENIEWHDLYGRIVGDFE